MSHTILLVDDEPHVMAGLSRILHGERYDVVTAQSAAAARIVLSRRAIDLVIADYEMPGMTGIELLKIVARNYPDTARFVLTGNATLRIALDAINEGAVDRFFVKPCDEADLKAAIRDAFRQKGPAADARRPLTEKRSQSALLDRLESENPGITRVRRDPDGAIRIDDFQSDADALLDEIGIEIGDDE
jgi:two-component system, probable response regulator PhcQ